jgi:hypothetical protein
VAVAGKIRHRTIGSNPPAANAACVRTDRTLLLSHEIRAFKSGDVRQRTDRILKECLNVFCAPNTGSAGNQKVLKMYIGGGALLLIIILAVLFLR